MAAQEDIKAASDEVDIAALYARLRQEIRRTGAVERFAEKPLGVFRLA